MREITIPNGTVFGRLKVVGIGNPYISPSGRKEKRYECECECGNRVQVISSKLKSMHTKSCGCLLNEFIGKLNRTHGKTGTTEYKIWQKMIARCYDKNDISYQYYGARGITVCDEWVASFASFLDSVGNRPSKEHSIDRIDNNSNYTHGNVRWATAKEQARNRRPAKRRQTA